ncbi:MAG: ImmA/IrrE family metallo-endopeptidase [Negativicutes bacterium]|nr:ImmA/IrrE family metallo-endopeptidase [Negativicutes bacterium]
MINIKLRVANLVRKYGTCKPYALAHDLGIRIIPVDLPISVRGFLVRVLRRKIILLNNKLSETGAKVVICHELGHARLHSGYGYYYDPAGTYFIPSKRETEANEFAAYLLSHSYDINPDIVANILKDRHPDPKAVHKILGELITFP